MSSRDGPPKPAEFDAYADGYSAGMDNPLKRLAGRNADEFIALKVRWLLADLRRRPMGATAPSLLDCGCGAATFLRILHAHGYGGALHGCDISQGMLDEAARTWPHGSPPPLALIQDGRLPYGDGTFDVVIASAVLHHVPIDQRPGLYREVYRMLRPAGRFYVFEHNPLNPVTRLVVSRTPIDANAILLYPSEVRRGMGAAGFGAVRCRSLMYLPPRWRWTDRVDDVFGVLPLGGQYAAVGERPR